MMVVLLAALKILAVLILLVVLLVVVALLLPLGFSVAYRPGHLRVDAVYGPLHRTVWSRKLHRPTMSFASRTGRSRRKHRRSRKAPQRRKPRNGKRYRNSR